MIGMLLAYDAAGNIVGTLDHLVARDDAGNITGLVDFTAHEAAGGEMTDIWIVDSGDPAHPVKGSKVWPEWLGSGAHDFRVVLAGKAGKKHIAALVHKTSGHRRERAAILAAIEATEPNAAGAKDIRSIVGGPDRSLRLDAQGRTIGRQLASGTPKHLPLIGQSTQPSAADPKGTR